MAWAGSPCYCCPSCLSFAKTNKIKLNCLKIAKNETKCRGWASTTPHPNGYEATKSPKWAEWTEWKSSFPGFSFPIHPGCLSISFCAFAYKGKTALRHCGHVRALKCFWPEIEYWVVALMATKGQRNQCGRILWVTLRAPWSRKRKNCQNMNETFKSSHLSGRKWSEPGFPN